MELRQLKYFVAVADTLNFSRASESLYVSQSALSKQIADLEQELGVVLFQRDKRTVALSPAGHILLEEAKSILFRSEKLVPLLQQKDLQAGQEHHIYIGVEQRADQSPLIHQVMSETIYQKRQEKPGLQTVYRTEEYLELKKHLVEGELDLGIFQHQEDHIDHNLESRVLYEDEMVLVYRGDKDYEDSDAGVVEALEDRGVILIEKEFRGMSQIVGILDAIGCAPQIRFSRGSMELILSMESGESSAIIPKSQIGRLHNPKLKILHFRCPEAKLYLLAVWKKDMHYNLPAEIAKEAYQKIQEN